MCTSWLQVLPQKSRRKFLTSYSISKNFSKVLRKFGLYCIAKADYIALTEKMGPQNYKKLSSFTCQAVLQGFHNAKPVCLNVCARDARCFTNILTKLESFQDRGEIYSFSLKKDKYDCFLGFICLKLGRRNSE